MNFFIYLLWPMKEKRQQRRRRQRAVYSHVRRVPGSCCEKNNHFYKKKRGGRRKQGTNRDLQGLVALVNARKSKELLITLQTAANRLEAASSPWKTRRRGEKGCLVQLSTAVWKMLTLGERKLMVLQTERDFPFTQITYTFQNVNSPAFPLRVQLSGGYFAMSGFFSSPERANLEATTLALGTKSDFKAAAAAASRAVNHLVLLGKTGMFCCPSGTPARSIPPWARISHRTMAQRGAGFTL